MEDKKSGKGGGGGGVRAVFVGANDCGVGVWLNVLKADTSLVFSLYSVLHMYREEFFKMNYNFM